MNETYHIFIDPIANDIDGGTLLSVLLVIYNKNGKHCQQILNGLRRQEITKIFSGNLTECKLGEQLLIKHEVPYTISK